MLKAQLRTQELFFSVAVELHLVDVRAREANILSLTIDDLRQSSTQSNSKDVDHQNGYLCIKICL